MFKRLAVFLKLSEALKYLESLEPERRKRCRIDSVPVFDVVGLVWAQVVTEEV